VRNTLLLVVVGVAVTEIAHRGREAAKYATRMAAVVEYSGDAIIGRDLDDAITSWNPAAERILGYSSQEVIGTWVDVLTPKDRAGEAKTIGAKVRAGKSIEHLETTRVRKDGTVIPVSITVSPIRDLDGAIVGTSTIARDRSEQVRADVMLAQTSRQFRLLAENASDLVVMTSPDRVITWVSPSLTRSLGWAVEDLMGKRLLDLVHPDDAAAEAGSREAVHLEATPAGGFLMRFRSKSGRYRWMSGVATPVTDGSGVVTGVVSGLRDVEDLVTAREAAQAGRAELDRLYRRTVELDEQRRRFFDNVSHELRTPLTLLLGPARQLLELELTERQRHYVELIEANANVLLDQVNNLLDLAKAETGSLELDYAEVDLSPLVHAAEGQFDAFAQDQGITLVATSRPVRAQIDPDRFHQVLLNLLSNAVKFTPAGGTVRCEVSADTPAGVFTLEVADSGAGVPLPERESVFNRFRQLDAATPARHTGTGLGLAIVKEIVELHHGSISVGDAAEGGASFTVRIPLRAPAGTPVRPPRDATILPRNLRQMRRSASKTVTPLGLAPAAGQVSGLPRVLVVEDNWALGEFIAEVLTPDFEVTLARDGHQGLRRAREVEPDLILSDVMMPIMSGDELLHLVRSDDALATVPFVLLTARADEGLRVDLLRAGANDFIAKPFGAQELRARVNNLVRGHRAEIRAHKLSNALKRSNDSLRDFVAVASHDLRSPLVTIGGFTTILTENWAKLSEEDRLKQLGAIGRGVERLSRLTDDLLTSAKVEAGAEQARPEHLRLVTALASYLEAGREELATVAVTCPPELVAVVDPAHLTRILDNYLTNAFKYGEPPICIEAERVGGFVELAVRDHGPGVPPEFVSRLFTKFDRGVTPATRATQGTGLGLSIVKRLAEAKHGDVRYQPNEPQGGCFVVRLPAAVPSHNCVITDSTKVAHDTSETSCLPAHAE
jgi:PAS domain S-box-containing protein